MSAHEITATRKDGPDPDYRLDAFKWGNHWFGIDTMISLIDQGYNFFVRVGGYTANVFKRWNGKRWYLTTEADGYPYNNLLHLPNY